MRSFSKEMRYNFGVKPLILAIKPSVFLPFLWYDIQEKLVKILYLRVINRKNEYQKKNTKSMSPLLIRNKKRAKNT